MIGALNVKDVDDWLTNRETILASLTKKLTKSQQRMKHFVDHHRREVSFQEGDWVLVKLRPRRQTSVAGNSYSKLAKRFYGPFQIIKKIGPIAYQLQLSANSRIHPVFHCSLLKPYLQPVTPVDAPIDLPTTVVENQPIISPVIILNTKWETTNIGPQFLVLVQWKGLSPDDTLWEKWEDLKVEYHLKDKVILEGHGNVMTRGNR